MFHFVLQWQRLKNWPFWIIRFLIVTYFVISIAISISYSAIRSKIHRWFFFITSINHLIVTMYALSCLAMQVIAIRQRHSKETADSAGNLQASSTAFLRFASIHWFLFNVSANVCSFVFCAYWTLMFRTDTAFRNNVDPITTYATIDRHGINLLLLLLDFFLSCTPVRLLHFVYSASTLVLFFIYNCIYWASTGDLVYGKVLDYGKHTGMAVAWVIFAVFIVPPLIQFVWFLLFLLRKKLAFRKENAIGSSYELAENTTDS